MPILDKLLLKNPIIMWLSRYGLYDNSFPAVPFARKAMEQKTKAQKEGMPERQVEDFLTKFLRAKELHPDVMTDREVLAMALSMVFAGSETT
jgi:cytochrome P450